jgi:outer membrane protein
MGKIVMGKISGKTRPLYQTIILFSSSFLSEPMLNLKPKIIDAMKAKAFLMINLFFISTVTFSQTEKGTLIVSGKASLEFIRTVSNLSYNGASGPSGSSETDTYKFMPAVGYFVANNFALGLSGNYSHSVENIYKSNELVLMPTLMYYIPLKSSLRPYAQAGLGYAKATEKSDIDEESFSGYAFGGGLGLAYFINENISIDLGLQLIRTKLTYTEDANAKITGDSLGSAIGFSLFF